VISIATCDDTRRDFYRLAPDSPEIQSLVQQLTQAASTDAKIRILSRNVQKEVRYVAIEIGIGGYQPHVASATLSNKYGDCKDKATLLTVMLRQAGITAYPVIIHSSRGVVRPEFSSPYQFNHMIVAIQLPPDSEFAKSSAAMEVDKLGRLLFFDPTAELWPAGTLVDELQDNSGVVLAGDATRVVSLPVAQPAESQFSRTAEFTLAPDSSITAKITETYTGSFAARMREELSALTKNQKSKLIDLLTEGMQGAPTITNAEIQNQDDISSPLILRYELRASDYAKLAGDLMYLRARLSASVVDRSFEWKSTTGEGTTVPFIQEPGVARLVACASSGRRLEGYPPGSPCSPRNGE
jgi:hypothetical protein